MTTSSGSPVTTIASENHHPSLLVTGFGDGSIKVFDKRLREDKAVVHEYIRHASWVENARWSPTHDRQFLSARYVVLSPPRTVLTMMTQISSVWTVQYTYGIFAAPRNP